MGRFAGPLFMPKIAGDELLPDCEASVGREHHVRQIWLRRDEFNFAIQFGKDSVQTAPLFLGQGRFRPSGSTHPRVDLVLDAVVIRRAKKKLAHKNEITCRPTRGGSLLRLVPANAGSIRPTRPDSAPIFRSEPDLDPLAFAQS